MRKVIRIDNQGYFIEDVLIDDKANLELDLIEVECPNGLYKPKWDGAAWIEGATEEYINSIKNQVQPPTAEEKLQEQISTMKGAVDFIIMHY